MDINYNRLDSVSSFHLPLLRY